MKPMLRKLLRSVVVIPAVHDWGPQTIGLGSVIVIADASVKFDPNIKLRASHPLEVEHERYIGYIDVAGRLIPGWIDDRHPLEPAAGKAEPKTLGWLPQTGGSLTDLDFIRGAAVMANQSLMAYIATRESEEHIAELRGVIRELGGKSKDDDHPDHIIRRALRLILNREVSMSEVQEARETAKKASSKKAGRKAADREVERTVEREPSAPRGGTAIGETLVKLGVGGKAAKRLAKGETLKKKELQALRDEINAAAVEARENNKSKLASQLSAANRTIRRMARAA